MTKEITLTQNKVAVVDDDTFDYYNQWNWYAHKEHGNYYAVRKSKRVGGKQEMIYMHTEILGTPKGVKGDHIDGNTLNNQRSNLRKATNSQSQMNRSVHKNNKTGLKGVSKRIFRKTYRARITDKGMPIHLGDFLDPNDAARAYDKKAKELFGEFARLNFPDERK